MTAPRRVVAVVPAFDPGPDLVGLVRAALEQTGGVVVVDDASAAASSESLLGECSQLGATVIRHEVNSGVGAALNSGVAHAFSTSPAPDAVLTLDQDSTLTEALVAAMCRAWAQATAQGLDVGLVAPAHVDGLPDQSREARGTVLIGRDPIQSGTLVPSTTWQRVGGFDDGLFIDGVDADYALRCLDAGLVVVVAPGTRLGHSLGQRRAASLAGHPLHLGRHPIEVTRSAPFRYYYLARNRVVLVRRHARAHPGWAAEQAVGLAGHLGKVLTLAPQRRERAREVLHGIRDGVRGVSGPRPPTRG